MKSILIQADTYYPKSNPVAKRMRSFALQFVAKGWDVTVITLCDLNESKKFIFKEIEGVNVCYIPYKNLGIKSTIGRLKQGLFLYRQSKRIKKFIKKKIDYVLVTSPELIPCLAGIKLKRRYKAKLVFDIRDIWPDVGYQMEKFTPHSIYGIGFSWIANKLYKHADYITTVSPSKVEILKKKKWVKSPDKVILIENGFDDTMLDLEYDIDIIDRLKLKEKKIISFVGNVGLAQGLDKFIHLASSYKEDDNYRFIIVGRGSDKNRLIELVKQEGLKNIEFYDYVSQNGVYSIIKHSYIGFIALVSSKLSDSIPTKLYENLGLGCPTLLLASGDAPKILEECKLGLSAPPENENYVLEAFKNMIENYDYYVSNKEYASERIITYHSRSIHAAKLERILSEIIEVKE